MSTCADRLKSLTGCGDVECLRSALQELCTEFGKVTRLDVLIVVDLLRGSARSVL